MRGESWCVSGLEVEHESGSCILHYCEAFVEYDDFTRIPAKGVFDESSYKLQLATEWQNVGVGSAFREPSTALPTTITAVSRVLENEVILLVGFSGLPALLQECSLVAQQLGADVAQWVRSVHCDAVSRVLMPALSRILLSRD